MLHMGPSHYGLAEYISLHFTTLSLIYLALEIGGKTKQKIDNGSTDFNSQNWKNNQ